MLSKFTSPNGSVLFIQRPREVADFVARQPRVLPQVPPAATHLNPKLARLMGCMLLAVLVVVALASAGLFLFGAERTERVRPELTPAQLTAAFRIPKS